MMRLVLFLFVAGGVGTLLRFAIARFAAAHAAGEFPWGTLLINSVGSLICGFAFGVLQAREVSAEWRTVVLIGLLGAFTTFSTLALETVLLARDGQMVPAVVNLAVTNAGGVLCLVFGLWAAKWCSGG